MSVLREKTVFTDKRFTVVAVESVELQHGSTGLCYYLAACLKPVAVVVKEPNRTYTLDVEAAPASIEVDGRDRCIGTAG